MKNGTSTICEPNQALQQTAAAILVSRSSLSHSAAAAAELGWFAGFGMRDMRDFITPIAIPEKLRQPLMALRESELRRLREGAEAVVYASGGPPPRQTCPSCCGLGWGKPILDQKR